MTSVDISRIYGPGVNEREFIPYLFKLTGERAFFILPKPEFELPEDIPKGNCLFVFPTRRRNIISWIHHQLSVIATFSKLSLKHDFDYLVMRAGIFPVAYWYIGKRTDIPYVLKHIGNGKFDVFKNKNILIQLLSPINRFLFKSLLEGASMADVVSESQRKSILEIYGEKDKVFFLDNGVNTERFFPKNVNYLKEKLDIKSAYPIIGYVGNLAWERGGGQIIESLPHLLKDYPNTLAIILGEDDKASTLKRKAKEVDVLRHCLFLGLVDYEIVVDYINLMDICVSIRYKEAQHASELKVRQYLACGKPVIVSPGANNFVEHQKLGHVVDSDKLGEFIEACQKILSLGTKEYLELSQRSRAYAVKYLSYEAKVIAKIRLWREYTKT